MMRPLSLILPLGIWWRSSCVFAQLASTIPSLLGQTATYGNNTYVQSWLVPTAWQYTYYWTQDITPTIIGTVYVVINEQGGTKTVTSTKSELATAFETNGTLSLLTRTDTNEAGTVTSAITLAPNQTTQVAYPTDYIAANSQIEWIGLMYSTRTPLDEYTITCCDVGVTYSASPSHYPYPSSTGTVNPDDERGWLYHMYYSINVFNGSSALSSLYEPATIESVMQYCPTTLCWPFTSAAAATAASSVHALFATTTVHVTSFSSTSGSVLVDPQSTSQTKNGNTESSSPKNTPSPPETPSSTDTPSPAPSQPVASSSGVRPQASSSTVAHQSSQHVQTTRRKHIHHRPTKTVTVTQTPTDTARITAAPIEVGSAIITPNSNTEYIIYGQTLSPGGPPITVSGTELSLDSAATLLVEGLSTEVLTTEPGVGGYIWKGLGGSQAGSAMGSGVGSSMSSSVVPSVAAATGGATKIQVSAVLALLHVTFVVIALYL